MMEFLEKFGQWAATIIVTLAGTMVWGRVNDRFKRNEERLAKLEADMEKVKAENAEIVNNYKTRLEAIVREIATLRLDIVTAIGELKEHLDKKYQTKEVCGFWHEKEAK